MSKKYKSDVEDNDNENENDIIDNNEDDDEIFDDDDDDENNDDDEDEDDDENDNNEEEYDQDTNIDDEQKEEFISSLDYITVQKTNESYLYGEDRISNNRLTKYELVRILGERTKQLTMGAKPLIKNHTEFSYKEIAIQELLTNMTPFKIKRPLPNGKTEIWNIEELDKTHLLDMIT